MSKFKKVLVVYLVVSSVILHIIAAGVIFWIAPSFKASYEMGQEFARAASGSSPNTGVVKDVSVLQEGDFKYVGCAIDYKNQTLYAMTSDDVKAGDQVGVVIVNHPYAPLKSLMVLVVKEKSPVSH